MDKIQIVSLKVDLSSLFETYKGKILRAVEQDLDIHHVGSTSVSGLAGKGIIDVMIGVNSWKEADKILERLLSSGFEHFESLSKSVVHTLSTHVPLKHPVSYAPAGVHASFDVLFFVQVPTVDEVVSLGSDITLPA